MKTFSDTDKQRVPALLPLVCALLFFVGFEMGGFQLVLRGVSAEFAMTATGAGLLVAAQNAGIMLMPPLFGSLSDRIGKKRVLLIFSLVFCLGCAFTGLSRGVIPFIAGVFLIGSGYSVCECTGSAALADAYPEKSAKYINLSQCMLSAGAVVSPVLTQGVMDTFRWSWRFVFLLCAVMYVPLILLLGKLRFGAAPEIALPSERGFMRDFLRSRVFLLLFLSILLYVGLENGVGYFTESFFSLQLSSVSLGAYAISAYWAAMALSRLLCGLFTLPAHRTLCIGLGVSALLFALLAASGTPYVALALCALIGFSFGPIWSLLIDLAAKEFPARSGAAIGCMSAGCGMGGVLFPALVGAAADTLDLRFAFLLLAAAALAACVLCYAVLRRKKRTDG